MKEPRTLLIEGWRFIPHSYAVVNQFQCLELLRRPNLRLLHRDLPFYHESWREIAGCLDAASETRLRAIPPPADGDRIDAVYRIGFPIDLSPSAAPRTCVFATAEYGRVAARTLAGGKPLAGTMAASNSIVITASNWSRDGFLRSGADPNRVAVVPHGVDPAIFHPLSDPQRQTERAKSGWKGFLFLSVGAMTQNKGLELLLQAFAAVAARHPHARLVLKGTDALYASKQFLKDAVQKLTAAEASLVKPRLHYIGGTLPFAQMAALYQSADAYVAPYSAEGFAMPVLEAIACGCPVICTAGGPTDDFTTPDFALGIESQMTSTPAADGGSDLQTEPRFESLLEQMMKVIEQTEFCAQARAAGPRFVHGNFSWKAVVDRLLAVLLPH